MHDNIFPSSLPCTSLFLVLMEHSSFFSHPNAPFLVSTSFLSILLRTNSPSPENSLVWSQETKKSFRKCRWGASTPCLFPLPPVREGLLLPQAVAHPPITHIPITKNTIHKTWNNWTLSDTSSLPRMAGALWLQVAAAPLTILVWYWAECVCTIWNDLIARWANNKHTTSTFNNQLTLVILHPFRSLTRVLCIPPCRTFFEVSWSPGVWVPPAP